MLSILGAPGLGETTDGASHLQRLVSEPTKEEEGVWSAGARDMCRTAAHATNCWEQELLLQLTGSSQLREKKIRNVVY